MKTSIKIIITAIVLLSFHTKVTAQIEDHYHSFSGKIYIPIIVDRQEAIKYNDGRIYENHIPDKVTSISFYMKAENMRVNNGVFSGFIVKNGSAKDEVITYIGKVSKDKKKLEYIEITKETTVYILDTKEDVEKTISFSARFENIPKSYGSFGYEYGISNIASVSYNEEYAISRYGYIDSYTETFVKINEKAISKYYTGVTASFKPGVLKLEEVNHLTISGSDTICRCVLRDMRKRYEYTKIKLFAKSNIPGGNFKWESDNEAIVFFGNGSEIRVGALADYLPSPDNVEIKVTQSIGAIEYSTTHELNLKGGYFYFWPDCYQLYKLGIITKSEKDECNNDWDDCFDFILTNNPCYRGVAVKYLSLILGAHLLSASGLVDPKTKLDSNELNVLYKLWDENGNSYPEEESGQPREFVKQYPCMKKWVELGMRKKGQ